MKKKKTLILIDGHALAFRQFYALERSNMRTSDGTPTWAVYGFFKSLFDLLKNETLKPDAIAVAFDVSHHTFRVDMYNEYKSNRAAMPDNLSCQMDLIYEGLEAFNIPIYKKEGYEADDVIGTISKKACELNYEVLILTGDQDAFQLIDKEGCVKVIIPQKGELIVYDWDKVYKKLGVYPNQIVDYKGLRGDTSDNIPGIPGVGEIIGTRLLTKYGTLENVIAHCSDPDFPIRNLVTNNANIARLSYKLATIVRDVDIEFDYENAKIELPNIANVTNFLKKVQFYSYLKRLEYILTLFVKDIDIENGGQINESALLTSVDGPTQLGLFAETIKNQLNQKKFEFEIIEINNIDELRKMVDVVKCKNIIAIKTFADISNVLNADIDTILISYNESVKLVQNEIVISDKNNYSVIYKINIDKFEVNELKKELGIILEDDKLFKITADSKTEINLYKLYGIKLKNIAFDVLLASYVHDSSRNFAIEVQSIENLDYIIAKANEDIMEFYTDNINVMFELTKYWIKHLDKSEMKLLCEMEIPLAEVLADMEFVGVTIDTDYLNLYSEDLKTQLAEFERKIFERADCEFNLSSPKQVADVLYKKLRYRSKTKKRSTSAEVLTELASRHEIADWILKHRQIMKLITTYTDILPKLVNPVDSRVHTTFNQMTTATGRLSSSNPNLQNIPIRTEDGNKIRKAFVPKNAGNYLLSADYSQIELRIVAHLCQDKNLINAFSLDTDIHTATAAKVFGVDASEVTKQMRYKAKAVNFGIMYGQSKYGLAKSLSISVEEADDFINKYFETYPKIKEYMDKEIEFAKKNGYTTTIMGRKRNLSTELNSTNFMAREFAKRAAINHSIQGSCADLMKIAMVNLYSKMNELNLKSKLIMQVHDELVIETFADELDTVKEIVKNAMELGQPLNVPLVVSMEIGKSWQEQ